MSPDNALIIQSDRSVLLEVHAPRFEEARHALAQFAELEKSPEHIHTYRITPLSLWNAASAGLSASVVRDLLEGHSKYPVPGNVLADIDELMGRFGRLRLQPGSPRLTLECDDPALAEELRRSPTIKDLLHLEGDRLTVAPTDRGTLKLRLAKIGYPVDDRVGFIPGDALNLRLRKRTAAGKRFALRPYQRDAIESFAQSDLGHGVVVLPCGAGKTVVGLATADRFKCETLVLCTNITAARQWIAEARDKTTLGETQIGEYTGRKKQVRPFTVATYQVVSHRKHGEYTHFNLFNERNWGLIIYDEVHLLPAPVFRVTSELQAKRRLGLTATLVREDGRETDVFALIGPKRHDVPWRDMEKTGFIAEALCHEVRVPLPASERVAYAARADERQAQYRIAAENPAKVGAIEDLLHKHAGASILIIGQYVRQLQRIGRQIGAPVLVGKTGIAERERLFHSFRRGELKVLVVSKIANFSIDLPEAAVCIQVSGAFGSRQEEAQRLGRILRPKADNHAYFYSLVSKDTSEMRFALNRQLFLTEQGYRYTISEHHGDDGSEVPDNVIPFPLGAQKP